MIETRSHPCHSCFDSPKRVVRESCDRPFQASFVYVCICAVRREFAGDESDEGRVVARQMLLDTIIMTQLGTCAACRGQPRLFFAFFGGKFVTGPKKISVAP